MPYLLIVAIARTFVCRENSTKFIPRGWRNTKRFSPELYNKSGRRDLNPGLLAPKASALAGLRYAPNTLKNTTFCVFLRQARALITRQKYHRFGHSRQERVGINLPMLQRRKFVILLILEKRAGIVACSSVG